MAAVLVGTLYYNMAGAMDLTGVAMGNEESEGIERAEGKKEDGKEGESGGGEWRLEWSEEFEGAELDTAVWGYIVPGKPDWQVYQSSNPRCYELRDGVLVLKGIVNDDRSRDPREYLCGGVWTSGKKSFGGVMKIAIRARLPKGAQGAWPALWIMPFDLPYTWPDDGEIDLMERLNYDNRVYQTLHSRWIDTEGHRTDPMNGTIVELDPAEWHTYEASVFPDRVELGIDGRTTLTYPKTAGGYQFPFFREYHIRMDMQIAGGWVGPVDPETLPAEMEIDWVRYYRFN